MFHFTKEFDTLLSKPEAAKALLNIGLETKRRSQWKARWGQLKHLDYFHPEHWGNDPHKYFSDGLKPPTRKGFLTKKGAVQKLGSCDSNIISIGGGFQGFSRDF